MLAIDGVARQRKEVGEGSYDMPLIAMRNTPPAPARVSDQPSYGPYFLCGWKVTSALPLPELEPWSELRTAAFSATEIRFVIADASLATENHFSYRLEADGSFLLQLPGLAAIRIAPDGTTVRIAQAPDADPVLLRAHLYGSVTAVLCYRLQRLPVHGACVRIGEYAVIFTGESGAGKSTLAAAFAQHGKPVLCDDVCAIDVSGPLPLVWPALPRLKLLPDAIDAFGLDGRTLYTQAARGEKGHFLLASEGADHCEPLTVGAIYRLGEFTSAGVSVERLRGAAAFLALKSQVHRSNMGEAMGLRSRIFAEVTALLATVPVYELNRPKSFLHMDKVVQTIADRHTQPRGADRS